VLRILLFGNPNVGKSVIFSQLTGHEVIASNYAGTTVTYCSGRTRLDGLEIEVTDVPGIYSLAASSGAEEVALGLLREPGRVLISVLDATNLTRSLELGLQLKALGRPLVFALNMVDVAKQRGITVDVDALARELGCPVVPTVAVRKRGVKEVLQAAVAAAAKGTKANEAKVNAGAHRSPEEVWAEAARIVAAVQTIEPHRPTFWERLAEAMIRPFPGVLIALLVLVVSLGIVAGGGRALRAVIFLPLVNDVYAPFITDLVSSLIGEGIIRNILIGDFGLLIKGIEWPFALILPYVFLFYIVLSFLEDTGYLPRLGILLDALMRRIGIEGGGIIPMLMGYGCAVPAILGSRNATSYKQRLITAALVTLAVPCASQTGAFIALLGDRSVPVLLAVYAISLVAIFCCGLFLNRVVAGKSSSILLEVPNLLWPNAQALGKKIWIRTKHFMLEAEIPMLLGIAAAAIIAETGVLVSFSRMVEPVIVNWLGLPREASLLLILGIIRRELAVLPMLEMDLTTLELLVGSVVSLFYLPCLAVLGVLIREFGLKIAMVIGLSTIAFALFFGGLINHALRLILVAL
jgi:ferrous iron transport protein B